MNHPILFKSETQSRNGISSTWFAHAGEGRIEMAIPTEYDGPGGALSPEDLFNLALSNCFLATFKVYAERSRPELTFDQVHLTSELVVDLDEGNKPFMKSLDVLVKIKNPSNAERVLKLAEKAAKSGFILNSVKTDCRFKFTINKK